MKFKVGKLAAITMALVVGAGLFAGCSKSNNSSSKVTIVGSTALQPLVSKIGGVYSQSNANVNLTVQGGGSGTGLTQVQSGSVSIGNSDVFAEQQSGIDASKLVDHKVAVVGIAPIVNKNTTGVSNLTMAQLQGIFTGKYTNWKQLGGKDEKIVVINRAQGSGTRKTFEQEVMQGKTAKQTQEQDSNGTVLKMVQSTPGAISYVAFPYLSSSVQTLKVNGVSATNENVTTNQWKIWSYEHMYTNKAKNDKAALAFIKYVLSSSVQKNIVDKSGYLSVSQMKVQKDANGKITSIK